MEPRTVIAFDFGTKRIGIAIGQELTKTATPLTTLNVSAKSPDKSSDTPSGDNIDWDTIEKLINEWRPQAAVVGLPLAADGSETAVTRGAKAFGEQLQKRYNLATYWMDERLTSVDAERMIATSPAGKKPRGSTKAKDKGEVDRVAAKIILESWFNKEQ